MSGNTLSHYHTLPRNRRDAIAATEDYELESPSTAVFVDGLRQMLLHEVPYVYGANSYRAQCLRDEWNRNNPFDPMP